MFRVKVEILQQILAKHTMHFPIVGLITKQHARHVNPVILLTQIEHHAIKYARIQLAQTVQRQIQEYAGIARTDII